MLTALPDQASLARAREDHEDRLEERAAASRALLGRSREDLASAEGGERSRLIRGIAAASIDYRAPFMLDP